MDDARRRRGRPALHLRARRRHGRARGRGAALPRFRAVAAAPRMASAAARARIVGELAGAVGAAGCCAGQAADLTAEPRTHRPRRPRGDSRAEDRSPLRRGGAGRRAGGRRGGAHAVRPDALRAQPRAGLSDHRRPARSRGRPRGDGQGHAARRAPRQFRDDPRVRSPPTASSTSCSTPRSRRCPLGRPLRGPGRPRARRPGSPFVMTAPNAVTGTAAPEKSRRRGHCRA